ncbi:surface lipoprotein assembly modifier [Sphingobium sp.]|uniref:surface lipoprotein assembly modifier n=1 Tax=Sphingobium sp. TaxID=1912891 RepID=UPI002CC4D004|nr:surface lipoprotein assembly modifier [Sphingobium sp.]HUD93870.1 surface lipoprotein assembly modifier [Sphingobium sp.]
MNSSASWLALCCATMLLAEADAHAQAVEQPAPSSDDVAIVYRAARQAAEAGNVAAAIANLERLLLLSPNLPNIRFELGILYLQAGSPQLAAYHLDAALAAPAMPPAIRARALEARAQAASAMSNSFLTGVLAIGARYESNANAGPASANILLFGLPATLDATSMRDADMSFTGQVSITYAVGLGSQRGHLLETDLDLYSSSYADRDDLNYQIAAVRIGPRFFLSRPGTTSHSIRPFGTASYQRLGGDDYLLTYGGGVNLRSTLNSRVLLAASVEYIREDYQTSPDRFLADRTGHAFTGTLDLNIIASPRLLLRAGLVGRHDDADAAYQSYDRYGASAGATYALPTRHLPGPLALSANALYLRADYEAPDPTIDPDTRRADDRVEATVALSMPVGKRVAVVLSGTWIDNASRLALYDYQNKVARMEVQLRF